MNTPPPAQLTHVGLYVDDMDAMVGFYTELMGMAVSDSGEFLGRRLTFLSRKADEHHQLVLVTGREAPRGTVLLSQLSFRLNDDDLGSLRWFRRRALELGAAGMEGRNHGNSWSIYFEDPEGNRLELYTPTPWYVSQPWRVALDFDRSDDEIRAETEKLIGETGTAKPVEVWQQELAARLAAQ
ncbi:VOC family protein [Streptomyces sp. NPDC056660]|uniref:VOC family protein n=1 Tax=Streptomyces sp. NPDC056660 TaxID=3345897 RepID=UPI0036C017A0